MICNACSICWESIPIKPSQQGVKIPTSKTRLYRINTSRKRVFCGTLHFTGIEREAGIGAPGRPVSPVCWHPPFAEELKETEGHSEPDPEFLTDCDVAEWHI